MIVLGKSSCGDVEDINMNPSKKNDPERVAQI
jgi:hypothetical protein